jgi:CRISPR/Cas system CSM-associated protein Csm3 (group 7 of RAMP superfamily)
MLEQISFTARLRLRSDLHIGTGETRKLSELRPLSVGMKDDPEVALIVRYGDHTPIIPATALKGALRKSVHTRHGKETAERLFGAAKDTDWNGAVFIDRGQIGLVWLRVAPLTGTAPPGDRPFWDPQARTVITTHVAIERKTGTAARQKLFYIERVPEGAEFELRGLYIGPRAAAKDDLPLALGAPAAEDGLAIGADSKAGGGCIEFDNPTQRLWRVSRVRSS